ncbi:MAG: glutamate-1-semialdehyde 2,1-aminomutase [Treponemataceae bacterium]
MSEAENLYKRACNIIPGGVNSPVRSFNSVHRNPLFIQKASEATLVDTEGNSYIDYIGSWGSMILGHSYPPLMKEIANHLYEGSSYGLPTPLEVDLAQHICSIMPSIDMVRLTVSGTEATMSAIRLARAYTKRNKVLKFSGCYHGHSDSLLCGNIGSGALTNDIQDVNGIPLDTVKNTTSVDFGNIKQVETCLLTNEYACLIVEPIPANMGVVVPPKEFIQQLRTLCTQTKTLLIFDEVISGFRVSLGGAQEFYKVQADITCLGKIIGGGFPVGAFGGKKEIMSLIAPLGSVYHAGTLSGSPLATRAGLWTIRFLQEHQTSFYADLAKKGSYLVESATKSAQKYNIPVFISHIGSLFTLFFTANEVKNLSDAKTSNLTMYTKYFTSMLRQGFLMPMSQFEAHFISMAHTDTIIEQTAQAIDRALQEISHG